MSPPAESASAGEPADGADAESDAEGAAEGAAESDTESDTESDAEGAGTSPEPAAVAADEPATSSAGEPAESAGASPDRAAGDPDEPAEPAEPPGGRGDGDILVRASLAGTVLLAVTAGLAAAVPDVFVFVSVPVALALFLVGCVAFLWAYAIAVGRSRYDVVSIAGLAYLADDVAPTAVRRPLRAALAAQVAVALVTAAVRPFTPLAFGVLAPTAGLGLMALWAARHGRFPPRPNDHPRSRG